MPLQLSFQPIDYSSMLTGQDPGASFQQGYQDAIAQQAAQAQQARALQQQHQLDAARQAALQNPSAENYRALMVLDPKSSEAIQRAHTSLDAESQKNDLHDVSAVRGYLRANQPEAAKAVIQRRIDADKAAGHDTSDDEQMLSLIDEDPQQAAGAVDYHLAAVLGPDKWAEAFGKIGDNARADAKLPGDIAKTGAETAQAQAVAAKTGAEAQEVAPNAASDRAVDRAKVADIQSQIQYRADSTGLERDKLATNTQLELEKLQGKGVPLSAQSEGAMNTAVVNAEASRQLASRASDLADKLSTATGATGGWFAAINQGWTAASGKASPVRELRRQYDALMIQQAIKNLPPGPASDKDVKMAQRGFPPANADVETMQSFLRGMSKLQTISGNREQARADWISENGNLGRAKRDINVNGAKVPAGASFADYSSSAASLERRDAVKDRSYMRFGQ